MIRNSAGIILSLLLLSSAGFSQSDQGVQNASTAPPAAYDRAVVLIRLKNAPPARIEEALSHLTRAWGVFPSLQYLHLPVPGGEGELLFLRGRGDEIESARRIAETLDGLYPPEAEPVPASVFPLPLDHLSPSSIREKILAFSEQAGLSLKPDQLLIFPPGASGSLFFRGTPLEAQQVREIKGELDRPRHESFLDLLTGFLRAFRKDLSSHFLTVSTYAASAILLLLLHFIVIHIPWLGKRYQRWFTLIWTRLINDVRGRDFAFDVIKSLAETAVESVDQVARSSVKENVQTAAPSGPEKKARALAIVREMLIYRGFNPDDPQVKQIVDNVLEAAVYRLNHPGER
jgi:hypothetical protein